MKTGAVLVGGILAGWVLLGLHVGCGPAAQTDCTLRALTVLPTDPDDKVVTAQIAEVGSRW